MDTMQAIQDALQEIRPVIQFDGGDVQVSSFDDKTGVLTVEFTGACVGCSMQSVTLVAGVESVVRKRVPAVTKVLQATSYAQVA